MITIGQTISHFRILDKLGAGGMGEVYLAEDTNLDRRVALKVLPAHAVASDDDRARFYREARAAATLNHPHIAHVYEIDEAPLESGEKRPFIAMEYVQGESLADRIARSPLPLNDIVRIGRQIASGLAAAHANGIVHRDIKPGNVMLTKTGEAKILDFGLAKTAASTRLTQMGSTVGTFAYMSPEQARGEEVDSRTDIWSLGAVLYEMITGRVPFTGEYDQAVVFGILNVEPEPITALRTGVPKELERIVKKCLCKEARHRYLHADEVGADLDAVRSGPGFRAAPLRPQGARRWKQALPWALAGLLTIAAMSVVLFLIPSTWGVLSPEDLLVRRSNLLLPEDAPLAFIGSAPFRNGRTALALSRDGSRLVYVGGHDSTTRLYQRRMDAFTSEPIPGTEGAYFPFFSPNGQWVGFFADNKLKKVSLQGGEPVDLWEVREAYGATWLSDDRIVYADQSGTRLSWIPVSLGHPRELVAGGHHMLWPSALPGEKAILASSFDKVLVVLPESGEQRVLVETATAGVGDARYVSSGHLVYAHGGRLMAAPFDPERLELSAPPVPVVAGMRTEGWGWAGQYALSDDGTLIYAPGGDVRRAQLVFVDRQGLEEPLPFSPEIFGAFQLSHDGKFLAISVWGTKWDLWIYDLERTQRTRLTLQGNNEFPVWTLDDRQVVFRSDREGPWHVYSKRADGVGETRRLAIEEEGASPSSFSADGNWLAYWSRMPESSYDIGILDMQEEGEPQLLVNTVYGEWGAVFSPNDRYLAYISDESGQYEVYVQSYPEGDQRLQVSRGSGAMDPLWSKSGTELFYHNVLQISSVPIDTEPTLAAGEQTVLFEGPYLDVAGINWDVAPGGRFLLLKSVEEASPNRQLNVIVNWSEELKRLAPSAR